MANRDVLPHNERLASSWAAAGHNYDKFSDDLGDAIIHCIRRLAPKPDEQVLDVATGTGWGARALARLRADVIAIDFSSGLIEAAQLLAKEEGLSIEFSIADAEALPFENASFDVVMSTFGVMFVQRPEAAAHELARVCRPGGRIGLTSWPPESTIAQLVNGVITRYRPPPPNPPPPSQFLWGVRERVHELLGTEFDLKFENNYSILRRPSGEDVWKLWSEGHGLTVALLQNISEERAEQLHADFVAFHERFRANGGIAMPRDYLLTFGVRK